MAGEFGYAARTAYHLPLTFILENKMKTQEYYTKLDYTTGALVKLSPSARVEGPHSSVGIGLIVGDPEEDGYGGYRVDVKWSKKQKIWKHYVEDLTIISPAGENKIPDL